MRLIQRKQSRSALSGCLPGWLRLFSLAVASMMFADSALVYGQELLRLDDRSFDNGPFITQLIAEGRAINLDNRTAYIASEIVWDRLGGSITNGTILWNGAPGGVMLRYRGARARLQDLTIKGGSTVEDRAGVGIQAEYGGGIATSTLHLDKVSFENLERGFFASAEPFGHQTGNNYFADVSFRMVRFPFWSDNDQKLSGNVEPVFSEVN
ncbi:MAG: hypothetical protein WD851_15510 [Pirellulales bacterium]